MKRFAQQFFAYFIISTCILSFCNTGFGQTKNELEKLRLKMVEEEIIEAGVKNERVIRAMQTVPRHEFVSLKYRKYAYLDMALPIGSQQTISPPFVVAYMTEQLDPQKNDRVLEIGTGSGYQAAVLSELAKEVYSIEIVEKLGKSAKRTLKHLGYKNIYTKIGDGYQGWPEAAPFDKIIVTCSPEHVPDALVKQLKEGGRMVVPVGERYSQNLFLFTKKDGKLIREALRATLFVPMTGKAERERKVQPDPLNPSLINGGFEKTTGNPPTPANWHYLRQVKLISGDRFTPEGKNYLKFSNKEPGRGCRALQGFPIDGREISYLEVSFFVKGKKLRFGQNRKQWPFVIVTFYDSRRGPLRSERIGPYQGTFDWKKVSKKVPIPLATREAIIRIGLGGAVGEISIDNIRVQKSENTKKTRSR